MIRAYLIIFIVYLCLIFQGCATSEHLEASSKDIERFKMTKEEMWDEIQKLKIKNWKLERQIGVLEKENQRIRDQNELLNEQINKLKEESQVVRDQNQALAKKLNTLQLKYETSSSESYPPEEDIREIRIKVLTGDGNLDSAKEMAKKLRQMGYEIESIDRAPQSDFLQNTVFFAPEFQYKAKRLVSRLGGNTIVKPLSWYSIFDIIIVTGKNP